MSALGMSDQHLRNEAVNIAPHARPSRPWPRPSMQLTAHRKQQPVRPFRAPGIAVPLTVRARIGWPQAMLAWFPSRLLVSRARWYWRVASAT